MEIWYLKEEKDVVGEVQHHHWRRPHTDRNGYSLVQKLIAFMQMVLYGHIQLLSCSACESQH